MSIETCEGCCLISKELIDAVHLRFSENACMSAKLVGESTRELDRRDEEEKFNFAVRHARRLS